MPSLLCFLFLLLTSWTPPAPAQAPDALPAYDASARLEGTLRSVGSDTMEPLMRGWASGFRSLHPDVAFDIDARGSGTAPQALLEGRSQLAPMSREMSAGELALFEARHGYLPAYFRVALDAIGVFVHPSNPLDGLTLGELDSVFSATQNCGGLPIVSWEQLVPGFRPLTSVGPTDQIRTAGRNNVSGTFEFFRQHALCGGDFRGDYSDQSDSSHVIWAVANDPTAIGFAGIGYRSPSVKMLKLARVDDGPYYGVALEGDHYDVRNIASGRYPLSRFMFIYVDKPPGEALPPMVEAFLRYALSREGQAVVAQRFFIPVDESVAAVQRGKFSPHYARSWWQSD